MVELRRGKSRVSLSPTIWAMTLELARLCGWVPLGTRRAAPLGKGTADPLDDVRHLLAWQTEYVSSDGQTVTAMDANRIADGLTRAYTDGDRLLADWIAGRTQPPVIMRTPSTGFRWFSTEDGKDHLQKLADFCREGDFQIF